MRLKLALPLITALLGFAVLSPTISYAKTCTGRMLNPATDICWSCVFPITIGQIPTVKSSTPDTPNFSSPVCVCPAPPPVFQRVGIPIGYWEPAFIVDVTKEPFCFVGLGGRKINPGIHLGSGSDPERGTGTEFNVSTWHAHWYQYPVFKLLSLAVDSLCVDPVKAVDVTYLTEVDPLWKDDALTMVIDPEAMLFGNLIAHSACIADCAAATFALPLDPLFWCAGCHGGMFPANGNVLGHFTSIQSSSLIVARMLFKMHRQTFLPITSGPESICTSIPSPMIKKSQYRTQLAAPVPATDPVFGCNQLGRSTILWESMREIPVKGEDFNYVVWRKRNCCVS